MNATGKTWQAFALMAILLAACTAQPEIEATPTTPTHTIQVDITPSARFTAEAVSACDAVLPGVEVRIFERFASQSEADLLIRLGAPEGDLESTTGFLARIATEELSVVVHPNNPAGPLTPAEIQAIFSGQVTNWDQLGGENAPVHIWVPLPADEAREAFDSQIMAGLPVVPDSGLAPDPAAMQQAIAADPTAVGYLPTAWLSDQLRDFQVGVQLPVLVAASETPEGPAADLVACLQGPVGQLALSEFYP